MKYRRFGQLDWDVSVLGFGVQSLPLTITAGETADLIRTAVDRGVNYLDLGSPEDDRFEHTAKLIGSAMEDGYRERIRLAAHIPVSRLRSATDLDTLLVRQLELLQLERMDFLILEGLNRNSWPTLLELGVLDRSETLRAAGRIGALGFSFRDHQQILRKILADYDQWDLCQFQYSYMDADHLPGLGGVRLANRKGLAIVAVEPLRGGRLVRNPPQQVAEIWAGAARARTLAAWGLHWVWNHQEVATVVCDMSTREQVVLNSTLAGSAEAGSLSIKEQVLFGRVRDAYRKLKPIPCAACRVCMPCPQDIDVPRILDLYNDAVMYQDAETARALYQKEQHHLDDCNECGVCANACGRMIAILDWLQKARDMLED